MFDSEAWDKTQKYVEKDGRPLVHCDKCGSDYPEGAFPFCKGDPKNHGAMSGFDDPFEPYVDVQLLDRKDPRCNDVDPRLKVRGVRINSRSERRALMKELGLQYGSQKFDDIGTGKRKHFFT